MSIAIMSQLFKAHLGSTNRKMLAVRLADFADDDGKGIWPTVGRLARETELSERTVQRILSDFVDEGLLIVRKKGGWKPGEGTRYDFDMAAIGRLQRAKSVADGCHGDTGDTVTPVPPATGTGDTDDAKGCHGDTQTVIEPPIEPSDSREGAREAEGQEGQAERPQSIERSFKRWFPTWPTYVDDSESEARKAWFALTAEERREAIERTPEYLQARQAAGRTKGTCAASKYLIEKRWQRLGAKSASDGKSSLVHKPFSKAWQGLAISRFFEPEAPLPAMTPFMQRTVSAGGLMADRLRREHRQRYAWPEVTDMYTAAEQWRGQIVPVALIDASDAFKSYHVNSSEVAAWMRLYENAGWVWPPMGKAEWICFPPLEGDGDLDSLVAEAVERYRDQISDYLANRSKGDDHAA